MVDPTHVKLGVLPQCDLLSISRSSYYYQPRGESPLNLKLMQLIDAQYIKTPFYGSRQMARHLRRLDYCVGRHRVRRLMQIMGIQAVYQAPRTSTIHPDHRVYPYLLRDIEITHPNQVWCSDITYIPIGHGFLYLVAVMDWQSRKVLSWRLSNTLDTRFCIEAVEEALEKYGPPEIFNTDQGSQFTSIEFTNVLKSQGIQISMDGKGRWMDNVFIERLWRSLKYECVYLNALNNSQQAREDIGNWITFYNRSRPHSTFSGQTPNEVYEQNKNGQPHDVQYTAHHEAIAA